MHTQVENVLKAQFAEVSQYRMAKSYNWSAVANAVAALVQKHNLLKDGELCVHEQVLGHGFTTDTYKNAEMAVVYNTAASQVNVFILTNDAAKNKEFVKELRAILKASDVKLNKIQ